MPFIPKKLFPNFYVDELYSTYKSDQASFQRMVESYSEDELKEIRRRITKQISRLLASIKRQPKSQECANKYIKLIALKKIRSRVAKKVKELNS